jgi:hypothetical protein
LFSVAQARRTLVFSAGESWANSRAVIQAYGSAFFKRVATFLNKAGFFSFLWSRNSLRRCASGSFSNPPAGSRMR